MNIKIDFFKTLRNVSTRNDKKTVLFWLSMQMTTVVLDLCAIVVTGIVVSTFIPIIQSKPNNVPDIVQNMYMYFDSQISLYEFIFLLTLTASSLLLARSFISVLIERHFTNKLCTINNRLIKSILSYHYSLPLDKRIQLSEVKLLESIHGSFNSLIHYVIGNFILILAEIFSLLTILIIIFIWKPLITVILLSIILVATLVSFRYHIKKSQLMLKDYTSISTSLSEKFLQIDRLSTDFILRGQLIKHLTNYTDQRLIFSKLISARIIQFGFPRLILEGSIVVGGLVTALSTWYLLSVSEGLIVLSSFLILAFRVLPALLKVQNGIQIFLQHRESSTLALNIIDFYSTGLNRLDIGVPSIRVSSIDINSLVIKNLTYKFPDGQKLFENINYNISKNGLYLIKGQNGIGKSTLFEVISGFRVPVTGSIMLNDQDLIATKPDYRGQFLSYLPQKQVFMEQSIEDSFLIAEFDGETQKVLVANCLEILNILNFDLVKYDVNRSMNLNLVLSEGEKQKIGLARTFVRNSKILLLDEPTNSLDYSSKQFLFNIVKKESERKVILMITHESKFDDIANGIWHI
jgi:ABC-type multidrug transport system fused ATPase/permease subunit